MACAVWSGTADHGASIAGGLHHAMTGYASGFCVYNDPQVLTTSLHQDPATLFPGVTGRRAEGPSCGGRNGHRKPGYVPLRQAFTRA